MIADTIGALPLGNDVPPVVALAALWPAELAVTVVSEKRPAASPLTVTVSPLRTTVPPWDSTKL